MNIMKYRTLPALGLLLGTLFLTQCGGPPKTYLLVIDTSGSMGGKGQLIEAVKGSYNELLDESIRKGDRVVLMTFNDWLQQQGDFEIKSEQDIQRAIQAVYKIKARRRNTDMLGMIYSLEKISARLEKDGRQQVIVIFSDGQDAPGPAKSRRRKISLDAYKSEEPGPVTDKYVYYISLANIKNSGITGHLQRKLRPRGGVRNVALDRKRARGKKGAGGIDRVIGDIDRRETEGFKARGIALFKKYWIYGAGVLGALLLALLGFIGFGAFINRNKPQGFILYYEDGVNYPNKLAYRLDRLQHPKITLGSRYGVNLRVRQLGLPQDFNFRFVKGKAENFLKPVGGSSSLIQFLQQKRQGMVSLGDKFKIGNFVFEYSDHKE